MTLKKRLNSSRNHFNGTIIYAGIYDREKAVKTPGVGYADVIGFDRPFITRSDLPNHIKKSKLDPRTFLGGDEKT